MNSTHPLMEQKTKGFLRKIGADCTDAVREYPVAFMYLTCFSFVIGLPDFNYPAVMNCGMPLLLACVGSLGASLVTAGKSTQIRWSAQGLVFLLALMYMLVFLRSGFWSDIPLRLDNESEIHCSLTGYMLLLLTVVFFPFWYRGKSAVDDSWSVTMRGITGLLRGGLVALCVILAMVIISVASNALLDITIFGQFWMTFVPVMLGGSLTIASFVKKGEKQNPVFALAAFSRGVFTFVSIPLLGIYLLIFYLYLFRVATEGLTPVREVSYQAIGVFFAFCVQRYVFHQALREGDNVIARWFNRISPWALLLPVIMMSWVIGQRLMTYGPTVSRLYVLLINLWMYGIIIWWILTGARKVWVLPVSFSAVCFLSSVTCLNVTDITETYMRTELRKGMEKAGWQLPASAEFFNKNGSGALTASQRSMMSYLHYEMGTESLRGLVVFDAPSEKKPGKLKSASGGHDLNISTRCAATFDAIPEGCVAVNVYDFRSEDIALNNDTVIFNIGECGALLFSRKELETIDNVRSGNNNIRVTGTLGRIAGGSVTYLYVNGEVEGGTFTGNPTGIISATLFMSPEEARRLTGE